RTPRTAATDNCGVCAPTHDPEVAPSPALAQLPRSEEHTSELQSLAYLVCRLLLEKKKCCFHCVMVALPMLSMRRPTSAPGLRGQTVGAGANLVAMLVCFRSYFPLSASSITGAIRA